MARLLSFCFVITAGSAAIAAPLTPPAIPELEPGNGIIVDTRAAVALGKALFWDEQAGSDGVACASCHFSAGADSRIRNQISPGFLDAHYVRGDTTFGSTQSDTGTVAPGRMPSGALAGPNYTLTSADFPLHRLTDYTNRNSPLVTTTNDVVSSEGSFAAQFVAATPLGVPDLCGRASGSTFSAGSFPARQVEPRNTPTTINAAFYYSNFWDGRANNLFNGVGVFGLRDIAGDSNKRLIVLDASGNPTLGFLGIRNASLASQAVGPPLSALEMSCDGRTFADVGRRMLSTLPLLRQTVSSADSVLGPYAKPTGRGLKLQYTYAALVKQAFDQKYWAAPGRYRIANGALLPDAFGYNQMEVNFSMFWGIAIMMYERTLISDQSRFDAWFASCRPAATNPSGTMVPIGDPVVTCQPALDNPNQSPDPTAHGLTEQEAVGFALFNNGGTGIRNPGNPSCAACHGPVANPRSAATTADVVLPVMSEAAYTSAQVTPYTPIERSRIDLWTESFDGATHGLPQILPLTDQRTGAMHDRGFFNIGANPSSVDPGNGGFDPYGNPLSVARMFLAQESGGSAVDPPVVVTPAAAAGAATVALGIALDGSAVFVNGAPAPTTGQYNRCSAPGIIEGGGTPRFVGCPASGTPVLPLAPLDAAQEREVVDGGFKTPSLRNVGLTAPYFHSGNYADLRSVVEFYARGGSRRSMSLENALFTGDSSGSGPLGKGPVMSEGPDFGTNVDFFVRDIKSTGAQVDAMVAFMLTLTDPRVQCDRAPFDHPSLTIRHGHVAQDRAPRDGRADDIAVVLPATGADGYSAESGYCVPNKGDLFAVGAQGRVGGAKPAPSDL